MSEPPPKFQFQLKREVKTPKVFLRFEIELINSSLEIEEIGDRITRSLNGSSVLSDLVLGLLRASRSSLWELGKVEISTEPFEKPEAK